MLLDTKEVKKRMAMQNQPFAVSNRVSKSPDGMNKKIIPKTAESK
jgi:hypothetical protein